MQKDSVFLRDSFGALLELIHRMVGISIIVYHNQNQNPQHQQSSQDMEDWKKLQMGCVDTLAMCLAVENSLALTTDSSSCLQLLATKLSGLLRVFNFGQPLLYPFFEHLRMSMISLLGCL
jgi:hypothetical protein